MWEDRVAIMPHSYRGAGEGHLSKRKVMAQPFEREGSEAKTEVICTLGEVGGVWPQSVMDDAA